MRTSGTISWVNAVSLQPMADTDTAPSLDGWDIAKLAEIDWAPWGSGGNARAKVLANADGYFVALVEAEPGYSGDPHVHDYAEFLYVISGTLLNQGQEMTTGDAYAPAGGISAKGQLVLVDSKVERNAAIASVPPNSPTLAVAIDGGIQVEAADATIRTSSISHNAVQKSNKVPCHSLHPVAIK